MSVRSCRPPANARASISLAPSARRRSARVTSWRSRSGDIADLPAPVYAKGFLRNYSTYLGLDADEMLARWRKEIDQPRSRGHAQGQAAAPAHHRSQSRFQAHQRPGRGPRAGGHRLRLRRLRRPAARALHAEPGDHPQRPRHPPAAARRRVRAPCAAGARPMRPSPPPAQTPEKPAKPSGPAPRTPAVAWTLSLPVNKGENHFTIMGKDPETARDSSPLKVIVSVPVDDDLPA